MSRTTQRSVFVNAHPSKARSRAMRRTRLALSIVLAFGLTALPIMPSEKDARAWASPDDSMDQTTTQDDQTLPGKDAPIENATEQDAADPDPDLGEPALNTPSATLAPFAEQNGGIEVRGPADWALDKVLDIAYEFVVSTSLEAIGSAADATGNEDLVKVVDFVDGVLGGSAGIEHQCDKILSAIGELSGQIENLESDIDAQFNALQQTITLNQIEEERSHIVAMSDSVYAPALTAYEEYVQASKDYSDSIGTTNESNRKQDALTKERAMVNAFDRLDYQADLTTIETYGINMGSYTNHRYLYNLDRYADESLAFDHQRFSLLTAGINDVAVNLSVISYVQRLEYDYWAAKADTHPDDDQLKQKVLDLGNELEANLNRIVTDVNLVVSEYANKDEVASWPRTDLLTLMRPYDFEATYDFSYQSSSSRTFKLGSSSTHHYTANAVKTRPAMEVYRVCVGGKPYLVVNGAVELSYGAKSGDVIHGMRYWEKVPRFLGLLVFDYYGLPDQDFFNLQSTTDGVYSMPSDFSPLAPLVNVAAYQNAGGSLVGYLANNGMASLGQEAYVVMNSYVEPVYSTGINAQNHYTSFNWYTTNIPANGDYAKAKVSLTAEDTVSDAKLLAVLSQASGKQEAHPLHIVTEGSGLTLTATAMDGTSLPSKVPAGTRIKLTVQASDPTALDSLVLKNSEGEVLQTIASAGSAPLADDNTFTFTMPYQEVSLVGTPGKAAPNPLHFAQDADGAYLVSTLDDLVNVAAAYEQHAGGYPDATFRLTNDIVNLRSPFPLWTSPIGTEEHPFTGTFDGAGHAIGGFTMDMTAQALAGKTYGGIFGVIGETGVVRDVSVYAIDYRGNSANQAIGGLAGANYGLIDSCSTGSAQTGITVGPAPADPVFVNPDDLKLINVTIESFDAGGLVAYNCGQVINSWSGADVTASPSGGHGGGLVGFSNTGSSVWNSYAMGSVLGGDNAGGLIGRNYADVHNTYYCGNKVAGNTAGSFIGANHHDVFASFVLDDAEPGTPFGSGYAGSSPDSSLTKMAREAMASQSFADTLNSSVTGDMIFWKWASGENGGFPALVRDPLIERTLVDEDTSVTVSGIIHAGAVLAVDPLAGDDPSHRTLYQYANENGLLGQMAASYRALMPVVCLKSGQTPLGGTVTLRIPLPSAFAGRSIKVLQENPDGVVTHEAFVEGGVATVQIDAVSPFAVIADQAAEPASSEPSAKPLAPTGDKTSGQVGIFALAIFLALGAAAIARRKLLQ